VSFGPFDAGMGMRMDFEKMGDTVQLGAGFWAFASLDIGACNPIRGSINADGIVAFGDRFDFSFNGHVGIYCNPPILPDFDIGLGFTINIGGFSVDLPWPIPNINVGF
jgi:hypothetical protein